MDIVSSSLPFYAHYFHPYLAGEQDNLFDRVFMAELAADYPGGVEQIQALIDRGIYKTIGNDVLIPLEGKLVMPSSASGSAFPLVFIGHGNYKSYFTTLDGAVPHSEFLSFQGHQQTQSELGRNGIASISINLNAINSHQSNNDYYRRIQVFFLHLLLLKILSGESVTIPGSDQYPIKYLNGSTLIDLSEALTLADSPGGDAMLIALQNLKNSVNGKFDFSNLGFMGHSRGANSVSRIFEYFYLSGTAGEASEEYRVNDTLNNRIMKLVEYCGQPERDDIKCIFSLQPNSDSCKIESNNTLFVVLGGTHDSDVGLEAINIYEHVNSPRVMFLVNGATHARFNSVWRSPAGGIQTIRNMIAADPNIRMLSNRKHDEIARVVFSSFFIATQNNSSRHYAYFTRDTRFPIRVDIQRNWLFAAPFQALPAAWKTFDEDLEGNDILNETNSGPSDSTLPFDTRTNLENIVNTARHGSDTSQHLDFTDISFSAFLYLKPINSNTAALTVDIDVDISDYTHFSFRFAKWYKVRNTERIDPTASIPGIPRRVDFRNFTLQLFENNNPIGNKINGRNVRSLIHRAYPALKWTTDVRPPAYYWDTSIIQQTVEVHKSEFEVSTATDFSRVNKIVIELTPERYRADDADDVFVFNDFTLTNRDFTVPTIP